MLSSISVARSIGVPVNASGWSSDSPEGCSVSVSSAELPAELAEELSPELLFELPAELVTEELLPLEASPPLD